MYAISCFVVMIYICMYHTIYLVYIVIITLYIYNIRESPVGIVAISQMAAGDGFADIIGRYLYLLCIYINIVDAYYIF